MHRNAFDGVISALNLTSEKNRGESGLGSEGGLEENGHPIFGTKQGGVNQPRSLFPIFLHIQYKMPLEY